MPMRVCRCGCGGWTRGGRFLPGHDAKLKGRLLRAARGLIVDPTFTQEEAINELRALGWLHFLYGTQRVTSAVVRSGRTFGIEIECLERNLAGLAEDLTNAGVPTYSERYNHSTRGYWKVITDASVPSGCEIVSPVLSGEDGFEQLRKVCQVLKTRRVRVNRTCGLHVHHGASDLSLDALKNVVRIYNGNQDVIDGVLAPSRRMNSYCYRWDSYQMERVERCSEIDHLPGCQGDRYRALNLQSYPRYGTVEFRQHQGTVEFRKIRNWVLFGQALIEQAVRGELGNPFETLTDGELRNYFEGRRSAFAR